MFYINIKIDMSIENIQSIENMQRSQQIQQQYKDKPFQFNGYI